MTPEITLLRQFNISQNTFLALLIILYFSADALVIYMGLPAAIYPPLKSGFFHTEMEKRLFPSQPALQVCCPS